MTHSISNDPPSHAEYDVRDFYHIYRLLLAVGLLAVAVYLFLSDQQSVNVYLVSLNVLYVLFVAATLYFTHHTDVRFRFIISSIDAIFLTTVLYFNDALGAVSSNLVIVSIVISNMLLPRILGLLLAALASTPILSLFLWHWFSHSAETFNLYSLHAAITCTLYFIAAWCAQYGTKCLHNSQMLAHSRYTKNIYLQYLNHRILDSIDTGVLVARFDGKILTMNQPALRLMGLSRVPESMQMIGYALFHRYQQWQKSPLLPIASFKNPITGLTIQVELNYLSQREGLHVLVVLKDSARVTKQMQSMKLQALNRLTASIAHEVRNPLGAISHAAQLLNESFECSQEDQKLLDIVIHHVGRVNGIIESVLQLGSQKKNNPCSIDLHQWVPDLLQSGCFTEDEQKMIGFSAKPMSYIIEFDVTQLEQVIYNLVNNALQHADRTSNPPVRVSIEMSGDHQQIILGVYNSGPSIKPYIADQLFEPFFSTRHEGAGLGLFISKQLCEANSAYLQYIKRSHGACFRVILAVKAERDSMHKKGSNNESYLRTDC